MEKANYDLIIIMNPELSLEKAKEKIESVLKEFNAEIISSELKGRKELQYERKKMNYGIFYHYQIQLDKNQSSELQKRLNIQADVLQFFLKNLVKK